MNATTKAMRILGESVENDIEEIQEAKEYSIGKVKLAVYDNGGETADRYTIVPKGEGYKERNGMVEMIGASENPTSPQGVYQHSEGQVGKHLGKRIDFEKLPEALQKALKDEFKEEIAEEVVSEATITFDGKNQSEIIKKLPKGTKTEIADNGKFDIMVDDEMKTVFKDDVISVKDKKISITKPSYVQKKVDEACSGKKEETIKEGHAETSELKLFIDNDGDLYRQQKVPMYKNLSKKMIKGTYDKELAKKLMMYLVEAGAKKYAKEAGPNAVWHEMFSMADRKQVASELVDDFEDAFKSKEYDFMKDKDEKKVVKEEVVEEGIGFELYSKGADRIQTQTVQINEFAKKLADLARENAPLTKKKKALKELKKWVDVVNGELKQLDSDVDNLEGYKEEVVSEADSKKTKLDFLRSRLASESGNDKKETEKEIEELEKDEVDKDNINETKDYTMDMCSEDIHDDEAKKKRSEELKTKFAEPLKYAKELETELQSIFPDSLVHMGYSTLGGGLSVNYELLMGKDKSEWANGISHNDPVQYVLWLHDLGDNDGKLVNNIEVTANQNSVLAKPTDKYSAYSRIKLPFRKKSGSPEQIKKYIIDLYKKVKDTLKQNIDNFTDEHKELISKKIK